MGLWALATECSDRFIHSVSSRKPEKSRKWAQGVLGLFVKMCYFFPFFDFVFGLRFNKLNACAQKDA